MNRSVRNVLIFAVVTLTCGFLGQAINTFTQADVPMQSLGVLVWLISPLAGGLLLRALGGDGWKDFDARPRFKSGWRWYLAALLVTPAIILVSVLLGRLFGIMNLSGFNPSGPNGFFAIFATAFAANAIKNIFEEFAWRGYLTPMLERMKANPLLGAIVTGVIWAGWHIPYYLYFLDPATISAQTSFSTPTLILLAFLALPLQALAYGELRLLSKSVWPTWLLHNMANAVEFALVTGGFVLISKSIGGTFLIPVSLLMGLIGWGLYLHRMRSTQKAQ